MAISSSSPPPYHLKSPHACNARPSYYISLAFLQMYAQHGYHKMICFLALIFIRFSRPFLCRFSQKDSNIVTIMRLGDDATVNGLHDSITAPFGAKRDIMLTAVATMPSHTALCSRVMTRKRLSYRYLALPDQMGYSLHRLIAERYLRPARSPPRFSRRRPDIEALHRLLLKYRAPRRHDFRFLMTRWQFFYMRSIYLTHLLWQRRHTASLRNFDVEERFKLFIFLPFGQEDDRDIAQRRRPSTRILRMMAR